MTKLESLSTWQCWLGPASLRRDTGRKASRLPSNVGESMYVTDAGSSVFMKNLNFENVCSHTKNVMHLSGCISNQPIFAFFNQRYAKGARSHLKKQTLRSSTDVLFARKPTQRRFAWDNHGKAERVFASIPTTTSDHHVLCPWLHSHKVCATAADDDYDNNNIALCIAAASPYQQAAPLLAHAMQP